MRIRKQVKQALSLILGTLITVFAFSLLLVTIADLNTDSTSQFVSGAHVHEPPQEQPQTEDIPQAPTASGQEHAHQEPPVEQPAAPPPVIEDDSAVLDTNPNININVKLVLIIIGGIVLAVAIIVGIVLLIRNLARSRLYRYEIEDDKPAAEELAESAEWESDISARLSPAASADEEVSQDIGEYKDKIIYTENRGYCFSPLLASTNLTASTDDASASDNAVEELKPGILSEVSSKPASSFEYDDAGESDIDYVDIPRLFSM